MNNNTNLNEYLNSVGIESNNVLYNPSVAILYEHALKFEQDTAISSTGALICNSGKKTGRSPKDKRIVREDTSEKDIWWGPVNIPIDTPQYIVNRTNAINYLNTEPHIYIVDGYAGWNDTFRLKIRVICSRAYHALFMKNMLIKLTDDDINECVDPDFTIFNAGKFPANTSSGTLIGLNFKFGEMIILGTEYAGEMKKGIFSVMHYHLPKKGVLSLHSSANESQNGEVCIFFGLSGTGKTTLSADSDKFLIGDDEHAWYSNGIFNIEGGCYAKCIDLTAEKEPEIFNAIKFGSVLENVVYDNDTHEVDYNDSTLTENTRCSYPLEFIENSKPYASGTHPKNIIMLCCDCFGIFPAVAKLTPEQALKMFVSGYTARVSGTEVGVTEPTAVFSACFGDAFLIHHPLKYAGMLKEMIEKNNCQSWIVNTGWGNQGGYGVGPRIKLKYTRAIIDAIHNDELIHANTTIWEPFNFEIPISCNNVPNDILNPVWTDINAYNKQLQYLVSMFNKNFEQYGDMNLQI
jgi:ATP-dependent phosphoenolpyruvate carboxykinase